MLDARVDCLMDAFGVSSGAGDDLGDVFGVYSVGVHNEEDAVEAVHSHVCSVFGVSVFGFFDEPGRSGWFGDLQAECVGAGSFNFVRHAGSHSV